MRFPYGNAYHIRVYDVDVPDGARREEEPRGQLLRYFDEKTGAGCEDGLVYRSRVPPSLTFAKEDLWGWCFLDEVSPVVVGHWLAWGIRSWRKRVPPRLFKSLVHERIAAWCKAETRERCPASIKRTITENARTEILSGMAPEVSDTVVLLDTQRMRLLLPSVTDDQARGIVKKLLPVLRHVLHRGVKLLEWDLESYLVESRPASVPPSEVGYRWLAYLVERASAGAWAVFRDVPEHDEPVVFRVTLDGKVRIAMTGKETVHVAGAEAVKDIVRWVGDEQGRVRVREVNLLITEPEPSTRSYSVRIDASGAIRGCKILGGETWPKGEEETASASFERAETMTEVAMYVRLLMHAFDAGPLERMMTTARQAMFWPGHRAPVGEWYPELPSARTLGVRAPILGAPSERDRRRSRAYLTVLSDKPVETFTFTQDLLVHSAAQALQPPPITPLQEEIVALWREGQHVEAKARYRKHAKCTHGEAQEYVEELVQLMGLPLHGTAPAKAKTTRKKRATAS